MQVCHEPCFYLATGNSVSRNDLTGDGGERYFLSDAFSADGEVGQRNVGASTLADMAKALVGASFLCDGMDQAIKCASEVIHKIKSWNATSLNDGTHWISRTISGGSGSSCGPGKS